MSGYLVHGSNGEFAYLSPKERVDVIRVVKEEVIFSSLFALTGPFYQLQQDRFIVYQFRQELFINSERCSLCYDAPPYVCRHPTF